MGGWVGGWFSRGMSWVALLYGGIGCLILFSFFLLPSLPPPPPLSSQRTTRSVSHALYNTQKDFKYRHTKLKLSIYLSSSSSSSSLSKAARSFSSCGQNPSAKGNLGSLSIGLGRWMGRLMEEMKSYWCVHTWVAGWVGRWVGRSMRRKRF